MADTILVITPTALPEFSARGLKQTLTPIDAAKKLKRTVNGVLKNLAPSQFRLYKSTITCEDQTVPAIDGLFPGAVVTVQCVEELAYLNGGTPNRPAVSGSTRTDGTYTFYRPVLTMVVADFQVDLDEWGAVVSWHLDLEEQQ